MLSHTMEDGSERPISFVSRSLTPAEKRYSQLDKEALAILFGVKKFHSYIYGRKFIIRSDISLCLTFLMKQNLSQSWHLHTCRDGHLPLAHISTALRYKPGQELANANALSRLPRAVTTVSDHLPGELIQLINYLTTAQVTAVQIEQETEKDPVLGQVKKYVSMGQFPETTDQKLQPYLRRRHELSLMYGCLQWGTRLIVPPPSHSPLLEYLHETHDGSSRMKGLA